MPELVIRDARLVLPEGIVRGELSIEGGRISEIAVSELPKGDREIDVRGKIVMPGVIDAHVHFWERGLKIHEDFLSGSAAAVAGGVTTVVVATRATPISTPSSIRDVIKEGEKHSIVDFAVHAGNMTLRTLKNAPKISSLGVKSFKASTCSSGSISYEELGKLMSVVNILDGLVVVHAEDGKTVQDKARELQRDGRRDPLAHAEAHPNEAEEKGIKEVVNEAKRVGCRLHIAPVSTRQGCRVVSEAKRSKLRVSAETCPHFLIFTKEDLAKFGPFLKVNPALRTGEDLAALWRALSEGTIDIVASDHAPVTVEEKEVGWKDIWSAQAGVPGVETLLPLMLTEGVNKGRLALEKLVEVLCTKPAQIFGFYPRKGVIREGSDADLVVVDLQRESTVAAKKLHHKVGWTPYEGMKLKGIPIMTISRGVVLMEDGEITGKPEHGRFLAL